MVIIFPVSIFYLILYLCNVGLGEEQCVWLGWRKRVEEGDLVRCFASALSGMQLSRAHEDQTCGQICPQM